MASLKVKELLCLLYSFLLFISGLLLIGYSVFLSYKIFYHFKFIPSSTIGPFIVYFLLGIIHLFLTWLGFKGPSREHDLHIILFMVVTIALLVAECALGVWSVVLWNDIDLESVELMRQSFQELLSNDFNKKDWESLQSQLKCCGFDGIHGYREKKYIPLSCCNMEYNNGTCPVTFDTGCKKPLARYARSIMIDGVIMGFTCCLFQAMGLFAFFVFFRALKAERAARAQRRLAIQRRISQENGSGTPTAPPSATPPASA